MSANGKVTANGEIEYIFDVPMIAHKSTPAPETEPPALRLLEEPTKINGERHDEAHDESHDDDQPTDLTGIKKAKIRWSIEEMKIVAVGVAYFCRKQGFRRVPEEGDYEGRRFLKEYVAAAQLPIPKVSPGLPRARRRVAAPLHAYSQIFWKLVEDAMTTKIDLVPPVSEPAESVTIAATPPAPAATPAAEEAPPPTPTPLVPPLGYALVDEKNPLGKVPLGALALAFAARVVTELEDSSKKHIEHIAFSELMTDELNVLRRQKEELTKRVSELEVGLKNALAVAKAPLPRVAIIGCFNKYFEQVKRGAEEAGLNLNLRFYEEGTSPRAISDDWAIVCRWAGHDWDSKASEVLPAGRYKFIVGSASAIVEQLKVWFKP